MNGVEILAVEQLAVDWKFNSKVFGVMFLILFGLCVILGIICAIQENDIFMFLGMTLLGIIVGSVVGLVAGMVEGIPTEYVDEYKVTVSGEVSLTEFVERYEIIDQQGKIYTVRERENNNG